VATLKLFTQQNIIATNQILARHLSRVSARFVDHAHVSEVRQTGMIVAIELVKNKHSREPYPWQQRRGLKAYQYALSKGVLLRPLGNVIYFMPPYIITESELELLADIAWQAINVATVE
jgi:adenosylmethionine-8-amino-7-oxononanoate aminotransferase